MSSEETELSSSSDATPATAKSLRLSPVPVERFDEYVVVARLGRGGMAEVILGLQQGPQGFRKLVAIKRMHAHCEEDPELVRMFLHEAALAALLQHPHVVQTYKVGCAHARHFIAMEYLEGQPLNRALQRLRAPGKGLDPTLAARIAADALAALAYVHAAVGYDGTPLGLVHRDVSPHNLFVTYDGRVMLLDFGVAKVTSAAAEIQTRPGMLKGKLGYLAPEQVHGQVDARADVWSVGVVLWEALSGFRLFAGESDVEKLNAALTAEIPRLRTLHPELPEALEQIVDRALQRDRTQRFESAAEMNEALEGWLASEARRVGDSASPEAIGRSALVTAMQSCFADAIRERRAAVLECFSAVDDETRWQRLIELEAAEAARSSVPPSEPRPSAWRRGAKRALAVALPLFAALAVFIFSYAQQERPVSSARQARPAASESAKAPAVFVSRRPQALPPEVSGASAARAQTQEAPPHEPPRAALPNLPAHGPAMRMKRAPTEPTAAGIAQVPNANAQAEQTHVPAAAVPESGRLRLESSPYAVVSLDGRRLGITPIDVELPAVAHTLTLRNPERGIETTYRVQVVAGESLLRRVVLE